MKFFAALGTLVCFALVGCQYGSRFVRVERTVFLMGTAATFITEAVDRNAGLVRLERMVRIVEETEEELSTWRDDSVLSAFNHQPVGTWITLPETVCTLLDQVAAWYLKTAGAFDPAIGRLVDVWGLRGTGQLPTDEALLDAAARSGFQHVVIDAERCVALRDVDVALDAGGFGKGAALERVRLQEGDESGAWLIDFGGQIAVSGPSSDGPWSVAVAHPKRRDTSVAEFHLNKGSLATSGGSERDLVIDAKTRIGHILDPRTGEAVTWPSSVTVWHRDALAADILSTALYVMGPAVGLDWAEEHNIAAYFITTISSSEDVTHLATSMFKDRFFRP